MTIPPKKISDILLALCGAVILFNLRLLLPWPVAAICFFVWFALLARRFGSFVVRDDDRLLRNYFGAVAAHVLFGLLLCGAYFAFRLTPPAIAAIIGIVTLIALAVKNPPPRPAETESWPRLAYWLAALVVLGDASIFVLAWLVRTGVALRSPWSVLPATVFIAFAISTAALAAFAAVTRSRWTLVLSSIHFFTAFSISALVYAVGFGFDPFIHRAAETALLRDGAIEPKQILYAGQYVLVVALTRLTSLPLKIVDIWLVPIMAALALPSALYLGLRRGLKTNEATALIGGGLLLLIPFLPLTFTVPFNLTAVMFLALALLLPLAGSDWRRDALFAGSSLFILLTHPLLGAPAVLLSALFILWNRLPKKNPRLVLAAIFTFGFAVVLPALFALNNLRQGEAPFIWQNPWSRLDYFLGLFRDPFKHSFFPIPWPWEALYAYRTFVPPILAALAAILIAWRRDLRSRLGPFLVFSLGTLATLFLLTTCFVFKDVISYEQTEFASRLLQVSFFLSIPALAAAFLPNFIFRPKCQRLALAAVGLAAAASWYFSYPQSNPKVLFSGPGVSQADVEAVHEVERLAAGRPHVVLANQMMAAAALQEFGFARYLDAAGNKILWYPIPTGGPLYPFFMAMNIEPGKDSAREAAIFADVGQVFFAVHDYWPFSDEIRHAAQQTADSLRSIGKSAIIIYTYNF